MKMTHRILVKGEPNCEPDKYPPIPGTFRAAKDGEDWEDEFGLTHSKDQVLKYERLCKTEYNREAGTYSKPCKQFPVETYDTGVGLGYHISLCCTRLAFIDHNIPKNVYYKAADDKVSLYGCGRESQAGIKAFVTGEDYPELWSIGYIAEGEFCSDDRKRVAFTADMNYYYEVHRGKFIKYGYAKANAAQIKKFLNYKSVKVYNRHGKLENGK